MAENKERRDFLKLLGITSSLVIVPSKIIASVSPEDFELSELLGHKTDIVPKDIIIGKKDNLKPEKEYSSILKNNFSILKRVSYKTDKKIFMYNMHTGEHINEVFWSQGQYIKENLEKINYFMRDFREDRVKDIHLNVLKTINEVSHHTKKGSPLILTSAYRTSKTNRKVGGAKKSQHVEAKAIDFTTDSKDNTSLYSLKRFLSSHHNGGLGYYPRSNFIHIDAGKKRSWRG